MRSQRATESQKQTIPLGSCGHPFPKALAQCAEVEARGELWFPLTWVSLPQSCVMPGTPPTWILYRLHSHSRPCNWSSWSHEGGSCMHKPPPRDTCFSSTTGLPGPQAPGPHRKLDFSSLRLWDPHCSWAAMVYGVRSHGSTEERLVSKEELSSTWREAWQALWPGAWVSGLRKKCTRTLGGGPESSSRDRNSVSPALTDDGVPYPQCQRQ